MQKGITTLHSPHNTSITTTQTQRHYAQYTQTRRIPLQITPNFGAGRTISDAHTRVVSRTAGGPVHEALVVQADSAQRILQRLAEIALGNFTHTWQIKKTEK
jgi:hypothetical protein